jgi:hypothetical protein
MSSNFDAIFRTIILIARPAAGKSEIIDYLLNLDESARAKEYHIGKIEVIDDFPFLWRWFEEDQILESMGKPRLFTDHDGYFKFNYLWNLLIQMINLEYQKIQRKTKNFEEKTVLIEFSRGKEHGGYKQALPILSDNILENSVLMYVDVPLEESLRKNRQRFNPDQPDSILEHSLPDEKLKRLYHECDFKEIAPEKKGFLKIKEFMIPYVVFDNRTDLTTKPGKEFLEELERCLITLNQLSR